MAPPRILIVGGSTRAAADSVRRAGGLPICADFFADLDLRMTAEVVPVRRYPYSLPEDIASVRADAWFYCGALENYPDIVAKIQNANPTCGPLVGTTPETLRLVRNPQWLVETLASAGFQTLDVRDESAPPETDGTWLQK